MNEINIQTYSQSGLEKRKVSRGVGEFGFELIDWGYLYLAFYEYGLIDDVESQIRGSLIFDNKKYSEINKEQFEKIKAYLKLLLLSFLNIQSEKESFDYFNTPIPDTLSKLKDLIISYSLKYSTDDLNSKRIDVFDDKYSLWYNNIYYQPISKLLYKCLNYFSEDKSNKFITEFFKGSTDLSRMLSAINIVKSKELKDIVSNKISQIDIGKFISTSFTLNEIENALIEAINSETHWQQFAEPLMKKIKQHFENRENIDNKFIYLLYEVDLLFAFKSKDLNKLTEVKIPNFKMDFSNYAQICQNRKNFLIAIFKLYYENKFDDSILELNSLLQKETKNIFYAFHLYKAKTLKAINE